MMTHVKEFERLLSVSSDRDFSGINTFLEKISVDGSSQDLLTLARPVSEFCLKYIKKKEHSPRGLFSFYQKLCQSVTPQKLSHSNCQTIALFITSTASSEALFLKTLSDFLKNHKAIFVEEEGEANHALIISEYCTYLGACFDTYYKRHRSLIDDPIKITPVAHLLLKLCEVGVKLNKHIFHHFRTLFRSFKISQKSRQLEEAEYRLLENLLTQLKAWGSQDRQAFDWLKERLKKLGPYYQVVKSENPLEQFNIWIEELKHTRAQQAVSAAAAALSSKRRRLEMHTFAVSVPGSSSKRPRLDISSMDAFSINESERLERHVSEMVAAAEKEWDKQQNNPVNLLKQRVEQLETELDTSKTAAYNERETLTKQLEEQFNARLTGALEQLKVAHEQALQQRERENHQALLERRVALKVEKPEAGTHIASEFAWASTQTQKVSLNFLEHLRRQGIFADAMGSEENVEKIVAAQPSSSAPFSESRLKVLMETASEIGYYIKELASDNVRENQEVAKCSLDKELKKMTDMVGSELTKQFCRNVKDIVRILIGPLSARSSEILSARPGGHLSPFSQIGSDRIHFQPGSSASANRHLSFSNESAVSSAGEEEGVNMPFAEFLTQQAKMPSDRVVAIALVKLVDESQDFMSWLTNHEQGVNEVAQLRHKLHALLNRWKAVPNEDALTSVLIRVLELQKAICLSEPNGLPDRGLLEGVAALLAPLDQPLKGKLEEVLKDLHNQFNNRFPQIEEDSQSCSLSQTSLISDFQGNNRGITGGLSLEMQNLLGNS